MEYWLAFRMEENAMVSGLKTKLPVPTLLQKIEKVNSFLKIIYCR